MPQGEYIVSVDESSSKEADLQPYQASSAHDQRQGTMTGVGKPEV